MFPIAILFESKTGGKSDDYTVHMHHGQVSFKCNLLINSVTMDPNGFKDKSDDEEKQT